MELHNWRTCFIQVVITLYSSRRLSTHVCEPNSTMPLFRAISRAIWFTTKFDDPLCDEDLVSHPSLLGLDEKLRRRIYRASLILSHSTHVDNKWKPPALLQVNRRIRNEACEMFYLENHFTIACPRFSSKLLLRFLEYGGAALYRRRMMRAGTIEQDHGVVVPRWRNLATWLKLYHDKRVPEFIYRHADPDPPVPKLVELALRTFDIVDQLKGRGHWLAYSLYWRVRVRWRRSGLRRREGRVERWMPDRTLSGASFVGSYGGADGRDQTVEGSRPDLSRGCRPCLCQHQALQLASKLM